MHEIFGLENVLSTFQESVWSHLKQDPQAGRGKADGEGERVHN